MAEDLRHDSILHALEELKQNQQQQLQLQKESLAIQKEQSEVARAQFERAKKIQDRAEELQDRSGLLMAKGQNFVKFAIAVVMGLIAAVLALLLWVRH